MDGYRIATVEGAAKKITDCYFDIHHNVIQPALRPGAKSSKYKVASGTEFACAFIKPITNSTMTTFERREINALFASHAAMAMVFSISFDSIHPAQISDTGATRVHSVLVEHIKWLTHFNTQHSNLLNVPAFLNANFWHSVNELIVSSGIAPNSEDTEVDY